MDYYEKHIENSMTPYILEEREMRVTQMDIFSRLMADRILIPLIMIAQELEYLRELKKEVLKGRKSSWL